MARGVLGDAYAPEVALRSAESLASLWSVSTARQLELTLRALDSRAGALVLTGSATPVSWRTQPEAEALLRRWKASRVRGNRDLAATIIAVVLSNHYGHPTPDWGRIGYPGPLGPAPSEAKRFDPLRIEDDEELNCDVVIVGSGAGGGCVAGLLAERGLDVIVLEKGSYRDEADFEHVSADAFADMYLYRGVFATDDLAIRILAGSTLGGGTTINWSTAWKTPRPVLEEWARVSGIDAFVSGEIEASLDAVGDRLNVTFEQSAASKRDELLEEGLKRLGWHVDLMPRAVRGCSQDERCGYCPYGCRIGAKQSSMRTYLEDAAAAGARIVVEADVRRVLVRDGAACGVEAVCGSKRLRVNAVAVVSACGAIETPALLLRSGLGGRVGHNLSLHPGTSLAGFFDDDVRMWEGTMQARHSNELGGAWSDGYGATLETGPFHPHEWAVALPWTGAREHAALMDRYVKTSPAVVLSRDTARGRVRIDRRGAPRVSYKISEVDERRIADGIVAGGAVLEAAGANEITTLHRAGGISYRPNGREAHDAWAAAVREAGCSNGSVVFASMHQMGSCAMGTDPASSAVGPDNESHEVRNLFVADASTFPTPCGVNPMISVYGIAHRAAQKIAARLA